RAPGADTVNSGRLPKAVRDMRVAAGASMDGFTASLGSRPGLAGAALPAA
ncbi:MAG: hypothetical protein K0R70_2376, partial [Steroidobacteraceae bacterium]|nr:hypothetical protein [Steroidobacteraceae bacterium]